MQSKLNIIFGVITIISLAFAVFAYMQTRPKVEISYYTEYNEIYTPVPGLDGVELTLAGEVTSEPLRLLTITFWNSGTVPISMESFRQQLGVSYPDAFSRLDPQLIDANVRRDNYHFTNTGGVRFIEWQNFERGYAFKLAIPFIGDDEQFRVHGSFVSERGDLVSPVSRNIPTIQPFSIQLDRETAFALSIVGPLYAAPLILGGIWGPRLLVQFSRFPAIFIFKSSSFSQKKKIAARLRRYNKELTSKSLPVIMRLILSLFVMPILYYSFYAAWILIFVYRGSPL